MIVALAVMTLVSAPAHPQVGVVLDPCLPTRPDNVRRIIAAELRDLYSDRATSADTELTIAEAHCENGRITLHLDDPVTGKFMRRFVDLAAVPERALDRTLALSIVELVAASWVELELARPLSASEIAPTSTARADAMALVAEQRRTQRGSVALGPSMRVLTRGGGPLFGARVGVAHFPVEHFGVGVDAAIEGGGDHAISGSVETLLVSGALHALAATNVHGWRLVGGPGLRVGTARLTGSPADAALTSGVAVRTTWVQASAWLGVERTLGRHFMLSLGVEPGVVMRSAVARAENDEVVALRGFVLGASLGVGARF